MPTLLQPVAFDTSVLVSVFLDGEEVDANHQRFLAQHMCVIGWPTLLEFQTVMTNKFGRNDRQRIAELQDLIDKMLAQGNVTAVDFSQAHHEAAADAMLRFGRGSGHPAKLNYGDCMAYAVAKVARVPLIYKGNDFIHTDVNFGFD
ncbi:MAG: type II toxin-antitoxin system VapC family toxin [Bosea sp. (in: a-proteobacteria)]